MNRRRKSAGNSGKSLHGENAEEPAAKRAAKGGSGQEDRKKGFGEWRRIKVEPFRQSRSDRSGLFFRFCGKDRLSDDADFSFFCLSRLIDGLLSFVFAKEGSGQEDRKKALAIGGVQRYCHVVKVVQTEAVCFCFSGFAEGIVLQMMPISLFLLIPLDRRAERACQPPVFMVRFLLIRNYFLIQPPVLSGGCFLFSFGCEPSPSAFWRWGAGKIRCGIAVSALLQRLGECRPWRCGSSVPPASRLHRVRAAARRRTARWKSPW